MNFDSMYDSCSLCPRNCNVNRRQTTGYCGCTDTVMAARAALHHWEEPCICLLYTSPSPRDRTRSRMPSSA